METKNIRFSFEDLDVWKKAVEFATNIIQLIDKIDTGRKHYRLIEQLEACSLSIAMNIAEGKGRNSRKEFAQFLYIARGSLFETITVLIIFNKNKWISDDDLAKLKVHGDEIGKMLSSLINAVKSAGS